jgi:metal-sulfur cluster biosynthetic enzyme
VEIAADQIDTDARAGRSAADLDAGVDPAAAVAPAAPAAGVADIEDVLEALRDVVDPELGINIVDLGLIYDVIVDDANVATLDMTLTSAACPLTDMIEDQVRASLTGEGLVEDFRINWVWMPPWDLTRITDDGRDQLRALGFSI